VFYRIVRGSDAHLLGDEAAAILDQIDVPDANVDTRAP
jgi:hypothetical protein